MGQRLHVPVPAHAALPPRPRAVRRRRGARRCRRSARAARTAASRTPTTSSGSSRSCSTGARPSALLDTYDVERTRAADENILNSTRATDFITPKSAVSRTFRDAVLALAKQHAFARRLVNSGRLSVPHVLATSPLNTPDRDGECVRPGAMVPGAPAADAPVAGPAGAVAARLPRAAASRCSRSATPCRPDDRRGARARPRSPAASCRSAARRDDGARSPIDDSAGLARASATTARPGTCYLLRPDQHVCARWRSFDLDERARGDRRATCND